MVTLEVRHVIEPEDVRLTLGAVTFAFTTTEEVAEQPVDGLVTVTE